MFSVLFTHFLLEIGRRLIQKIELLSTIKLPKITGLLADSKQLLLSSVASRAKCLHCIKKMVHLSSETGRSKHISLM